jgi:hypothetical protein
MDKAPDYKKIYTAMPEYKALTKILKDVTFPAVVKRGSIKFQDKRFKNVFYVVAHSTDTCHLTPAWQLLRKNGTTTQLNFDYTSYGNPNPGLKQYREAFKMVLEWYKRTELRMAIRELKGLL